MFAVLEQVAKMLNANDIGFILRQCCNAVRKQRREVVVAVTSDGRAILPLGEPCVVDRVGRDASVSEDWRTKLDPRIKYDRTTPLGIPACGVATFVFDASKQ
jgi:hypothetical protein